MVIGSSRALLRRVATLVVALSALALPGAALAAGAATTGSASQTYPTSATITGTITPGAAGAGAYRFDYGTSASYSNHTQVKSFPAGSSPIPVQETITGLSPSTTYHFRLVTLQGSGATATASAGSDVTFTTPSPTDPSGVAGVATTKPATALSSTGATLNGIVDPQNMDSVYEFAYGTTLSYGQHTAPQALQGSTAVPVAQRISGLEPGTTYHVRLLVVQGSYPAQTASTGADLTFTTPAARSPHSTGGGHTASGPKYGRVSLVSNRIRAANRVAAVVLRCTGARGAACRGRFSITARTLASRGRPARTILCASGGFTASGGNSHSVKSGVSNACWALLRSVRSHHAIAAFAATFSTHQGPLRARVVLLG